MFLCPECHCVLPNTVNVLSKSVLLLAKHMNKNHATVTSDTQFDLQSLLASCGQTNSPLWQVAWNEFVKRYKEFIWQKVNYRCSQLKIPRLSRQRSEVVGDVVSEVFLKLCKDECKALRSFRGHNNERVFLSWLGVICKNTCDNVMKVQFKRIISDRDVSNFQDASAFELDTTWELYETVLKILQTSVTKKMKQRRRDIKIFFMYVWDDVSANAFQSHRFSKQISLRALHTIVYRMRKILRAHPAFRK